MSVETNSVPPWKLALLEKKKRQEGDRRKQDNEDQRFSQMPAWKQEIIRKKQNQKNSTVFLRKPQSPDRFSDEGDGLRIHSSGKLLAENHDVPNIAVEGNGTEDGDNHIPPITQNPLVKNDPKFKAAKQTRHSWLGGQQSGVSSSHSNSSCTDTDGAINRNSATLDDEVFSATEEEVQYGRGFVHKLLQRFSHLSTKDEGESVNPGLAARRSSSSENILEGRLSPGYHSNGKLTSPRTRSTDNLLSPSSSYLAPVSPPVSPPTSYTSDPQPPLSTPQYSSTQYSTTQYSTPQYSTQPSVTNESVSNHSEDEADLHNTSIASSDSIVEELPKPNTVRTARSVFESIATHPTSPVEFPSHKKPKAPAPDYGKYYNDTLSRRSGAALSRSDSADKDDTAFSSSSTENRKDPVSVVETPVAAAAATEKSQQSVSPRPSTVNSWNFSGTSDSSSKENQKKSFLYPASKPSQEVSKEPVHLTNGTSPKPVNGDVRNSERVLHIDNNVDESNTDTLPATTVNNKQFTNNRNDSKKPDHNRLNLNLQLDKKERNDNQDNTAVESLNARNKLKKVKRPAPTGPGSMLIRPASNLVTGTKVEFLELTKYNDVKRGEFAPPAKKRLPSDSDDEDVPVTNIDDVIDDIPVTDIDNLPRSDANDNVVKKSKYDFIGGNVSLSKNLLVKTRHGKRVSNKYSRFFLFQMDCQNFLVMVFKYPLQKISHQTYAG